MSEDHQVRPLVPDDLDAFIDVTEEVAAEGLWIGTEAPFDRERRRKKALEGLANETMVFYVVEIDGRIVGGLGLEQVIPGLYEMGMMLLEEYRGRGLGSALMETAIDAARTLDAYKLTLQVWPHNERALALYEKFGFEREGYLVKQWRRRNGDLWDAVVMGRVFD